MEEGHINFLPLKKGEGGVEGGLIRERGLNRGFAVYLTKMWTACSNLVPRFLSYSAPSLSSGAE